MRLLIVMTSLLSLAACAEQISETRGTYSEFGRTFPSVTRTYRAEDGSTYSRTTIIVGAQRTTCITGDRSDCNAALNVVLSRTVSR